MVNSGVVNRFRRLRLSSAQEKGPIRDRCKSVCSTINLVM